MALRLLAAIGNIYLRRNHSSRTAHRASCMTAPAFCSCRSTGKERDTESGLDYFGARYYGSSMGRMMSPDPLLSSGRPWDPQTWNRYSYSLNNPLRFTDPTGLYEWDASLGGDTTDKQLRQNAGKDKAAKANAKSIIKQRNAIRSELSALAHSGVVSLK